MAPVDRPVVVDATPIIALSLVGQFSLLRRLYGEISIPPAVHSEIVAGGPGRAGSQEVSRSGWVKVTPLSDPRRADLLSDLDRGEAEVVALAQERDARLVVLDERLARRHARKLGLKLTGSLGILLAAKRAGHVQEVAPLLHRLQSAGIFLAPPLVREVLRLAGESP